MKKWKAKKLNKTAGYPESKPEQIIEAIGLKEGQTIADIGAGGGYFTLKFADIIGEKGIVYAIDIEPEFLNFIKENAEKKGLDNIITILTKGDLDVPEQSLDFIFMRNVTHHISNRIAYFMNLKKFLKPDGKIAIIEYKKNKKFTFPGLLKHYLPEETIIQEMQKAGYPLLEKLDFLPHQHFTIYTKRLELLSK